MRSSAHILLALWSACSTPEPVPAPAPPAAAYVGSASCSGCHPEQDAAWQQSTHHRAEQPAASQASVLAQPDAPALTRDPAHPVVGILGIDPLWQPLVQMEDGRVQVSSQAYDPARAEWFEVFDDPREPGDWGHWTGRGMTWNSQCAACHNTGVNKGWDRVRDVYATTIAEQAVGCEACHGPSSLHAADPTTATPSPQGRDRTEDTCASCHIRWTPATDAFVAGDALLDHGLPALPVLDPGFHADGAVIAESFEAIAFRSSRMHAAGVRCVDCHDPHTSALPAPGAAVCITCHAGLADHDHHGPSPDAPSCLDCHMPVTTYMQRDPRHDHGFRVPDPVLDAALGFDGACARCHDDPQATAKAAEAWWPVPRDRARTAALHAALRGEHAQEQLAAAYAHESHPLWRAVLLAMRPDAASDRQQALASEDPWMRRAAVTQTDPTQPWVAAALSDPVRAVRLEAANTLQPVLDPQDPRAAPFRTHLERLSDHASAAHTLGTWWAGHGHPEQAIQVLSHAIELDPASATTWRTLAITQSAAGSGPEAVATLERATQRLPEDAELHFLLGLARAGTGGDVVPPLRAALKADPTHARAAYNLGLALHARQDPEGIRWLTEAARLSPDDPSAPYALATIALGQGDHAAARTHVEQALGRDPNHVQARALLAQLTE